MSEFAAAGIECLHGVQVDIVGKSLPDGHYQSYPRLNYTLVIIEQFTG